MGKIKYRKIPGKVAASAVLIALLGAGVAALSVDMIADFEGYVPEAYQYPVGIWTKCFGDTADVVPGARYTFDQYLDSLNAAVYAHAGPVLRCVPGLAEQPYKVRAAFVSMAYNIGTQGFCTPSVARYANTGDWKRACTRMVEIYKTAKGKELPGLARRRQAESALCLQGLSYGDRFDPKIRERMNQIELMQSMMGEDSEKPVLKDIAGRLVHVYPDGTVREIADYSEQEAALKRAGRDVNQTSVNLPPMEKEQDKVIGKELGEYPKKFYEITTKSGNKLKKIQTMNFLLEGIQTGTLSVADKKLGQMLSSLGIKWNGTNILEAADAIANELALEVRSTADGGGLPGATSDKDINFLLSMNLGIVMTPEGRTDLERIVREDYTFKKIRFNRMNDIMRKNGGRLPTSFYQEISDYEGSNLVPVPVQQPSSGNKRFRYTINGERQ
uniref:lysozyme n=1 Tax=uncultured Bilophila sp. TaxID=529385 RepID=UPI0025F5BE90|nr:lysozyme [uncultured Bilophila sp.]